MRDWPPCPPIQRDSGRRSRPGVNPFISALTVARCPATFPGVWPQLRDTLSTSWSVGRGTGAFIYALSADESRPALAAPRHASTALFSCRFKCPCPPRRQRHFHGNADRAYNTLHFASQSRVPNGGVAPFGNPHKKRRYATPPRGAYRLFLLSSPPAVSVEQKSAWDWCGIFNYVKLPAPNGRPPGGSPPAFLPGLPDSSPSPGAAGGAFLRMSCRHLLCRHHSTKNSAPVPPHPGGTGATKRGSGQIRAFIRSSGRAFPPGPLRYTRHRCTSCR